jgi:hypothetical protein
MALRPVVRCTYILSIIPTVYHFPSVMPNMSSAPASNYYVMADSLHSQRGQERRGTAHLFVAPPPRSCRELDPTHHQPNLAHSQQHLSPGYESRDPMLYESALITRYEASPNVFGSAARAPQTKAHKLCGPCCNARRAVIALNSVSLAIRAFILPLCTDIQEDEEALHYFLPFDLVTSFATADTRPTYEQSTDTHRRRLVIVYVVGRMIVDCIGIYGGAAFNQWLVGVSFFAYAVDIVLAIKRLDWLVAVTLAFFAYPHARLVYELRQGIINKDSYHLEHRPCCCC